MSLEDIEKYEKELTKNYKKLDKLLDSFLEQKSKEKETKQIKHLK